MNYCPNCGEKLQTGKNFCPNCGERIETSQNNGNDFEKPIYDMTDYYFSKEKFINNKRKRLCPKKELSYEEHKTSRIIFWLALLPTIVSMVSAIIIIIAIGVQSDPSLSDLFVIWAAPGALVMLLISLFTNRNYKKDGGRYNSTLRAAFIFRIISTVISSIWFGVFLYSSIVYTIDPYLAYEFWWG